MKGLLPGTKRSPRPLVYHPLPGTYVVANSNGVDGETPGAGVDKTMTYTRDVAGLGGIPTDGRVKAFTVLMIGRGTTVETDTLYIHDYEQPNRHGVVQNAIGGATNGNGPGIYFGKVSGIYESGVGIVRTGGKHNTQFKYAAACTSGSMTLYLRILGWWEEAA